MPGRQPSRCTFAMRADLTFVLAGWALDNLNLLLLPADRLRISSIPHASSRKNTRSASVLAISVYISNFILAQPFVSSEHPKVVICLLARSKSESQSKPNNRYYVSSSPLCLHVVIISIRASGKAPQRNGQCNKAIVPLAIGSLLRPVWSSHLSNPAETEMRIIMHFSLLSPCLVDVQRHCKAKSAQTRCTVDRRAAPS